MKYKTKEEILQLYPSLKPIWESIVHAVLQNEGAIYYAQPLNIFISVYGVAGLQVVFLVSQCSVIGSVCHILPSNDGNSSLSVDDGLLISLEKIKKHFPHLLRRKKGKQQPFDVLMNITKKGNTFMFDSYKGQNLLILYVGQGLNKIPMYRIYELLGEHGSTLRLTTPNVHLGKED